MEKSTRISAEIMDKLRSMSNRELAALYSGFAETPIKKFESHTAGLVRLDKELLERGMELFLNGGFVSVRAAESEAGGDADEAKPADLQPKVVGGTEVDASRAPEVQEAPKAPEVQTAQEAPTTQDAPTVQEAPTTQDVPKTAEPKRTVARDSRYMNHTIELVSEKNPKRPGTKAWTRFGRYISGMTTEEYQELVLREDLGDRRDVLRDLWWDSKHEFIRLTPPPAGEASASAPAPQPSEAGQASQAA